MFCLQVSSHCEADETQDVQDLFTIHDRWNLGQRNAASHTMPTLLNNKGIQVRTLID